MKIVGLFIDGLFPDPRMLPVAPPAVAAGWSLVRIQVTPTKKGPR
jgi:hypothetical protein